MVTLWALEQFELKCDAFSVKNLARIKSLAFSDEVDTGSSQKMRPNKS